MLGLAAYVRAGGDPRRRDRPARSWPTASPRWAHGTAGTWPYGAILPWALSRSMWHAWGAQMPAALAAAGTALHAPQLLRPAVGDAAVFTPHLLTATGPDNGWLPAPIDGSQIAYGADARVQALLAVADATALARPAAARRRRRRLVLRPEPGRRAPSTTRPPASPTTASARTARSTSTPAPSRPSTACSPW